MHDTGHPLSTSWSGTSSCVRNAAWKKTLDSVPRQVLKEYGWKVKGRGNATERLGLKASTFRFRMKKLGIECRPNKPR